VIVVVEEMLLADMLPVPMYPAKGTTDEPITGEPVVVNDLA
jgi:hypothetical protein